MDKKQIIVSAIVLKWARVTLYGANKQEAAERLKVTVTELDNWEKNDPTITVSLLKRMSKVYKRHVSVLLYKNPPKSQEAPKFRKLPSFEEVEFDRKTFMAIRQAQEIQNNAIFLLEDEENLSLKELIESSDDWNKLSIKLSDLLKIDKDFRFHNNNSAQQLKIWKRSLESLGILILEQSFPMSDIRAFTIYDKVAPIIVLNSSDTDNGRIFSLFHELGHLVRKQTDTDQILDLSISSKHKEEYFSNNFAATFLVPKDLLDNSVKSINNFNEDSVKIIANKFKVSTSVIWIRLKDLNYINQNEFNKIRKKLSTFDPFSVSLKKKGKTGGNKNTYLYTTMNRKGELFISEVFNALNTKRLTYYEVLNYIGIKAETLLKLQKLMFA